MPMEKPPRSAGALIQVNTDDLTAAVWTSYGKRSDDAARHKRYVGWFLHEFCSIAMALNYTFEVNLFRTKHCASLEADSGHRSAQSKPGRRSYMRDPARRSLQPTVGGCRRRLINEKARQDRLP